MIKLLGVTNGSGRIPGALIKRAGLPPPKPPVAVVGGMRIEAVMLTVPA